MVFGLLANLHLTTALNGLSVISVDKLGFVGPPRLIKKENVFLNGYQPPLPPLSTACQLSTSCEPLPRMDHPRRVLVLDPDPVILPEVRPRIISPTSVLGGSILTPITEHSSDEHQLSSLHPHDYDKDPQTTLKVSFYPNNPSNNVVKPNLLSEHVANHTSGGPDISDLTLDYSHLICSHNIDDFGADIAYGKDGSVLSYSSQQFSQLECEPDFSFIDDIYESVKAEIFAERKYSSAQMATTSACIAPEESVTPIISLPVDKPFTVVNKDGKQYKVVLHADEETSEKITSCPKRKSLSISHEPKPKRASGVTLANMSIEEINKRKREQNRVAAQRYRQKQKYVKDADKEEQDRLEKRNLYLRTEAARLQDEIEHLRKKILGSLAKR